MILKAIPRQGGTEEISINIDENASVADLRRFLEKHVHREASRISIYVNGSSVSDGMSIQDTGLQDGDTFQYSIATKKRIYTFDWNGKLIHPEINVDLPISDVEVFVTNKLPGLRNTAFQMCCNDFILDDKTKPIGEYPISNADIIYLEIVVADVKVTLPTGNEKTYSILKNKTVHDLKELIAASLCIAPNYPYLLNNNDPLDDSTLIQDINLNTASLFCSIRILIQLPNGNFAPIFWDIASNLTANVDFLVSALISNGHIQLSPTDTVSLYNHGELISPSLSLLSFLKVRNSQLIAKVYNRYSNLGLMIQHKKMRRRLVLTQDVTVSQLKQSCLDLYSLSALNTRLFYNGAEMEDDKLVSFYGITATTFLFMTTEEEVRKLDPQAIDQEFRSLIREKARSSPQLLHCSKWLLECFSRGLLLPKDFTECIGDIYRWVANCKDAALITLLAKILCRLFENNKNLPLIPEAIRQVMAGLMFSLSKNSYEGTPYCVDLISQLYARDEEIIRRSSWSNTFFYQLYSVLFLMGTIPEEMASSLQQLLTVLVAMHTKDPTLEFKNALTPEKLFLNRYPELEEAFHPIALGLLETMNDALSIGYILEHYFADEEIVLTIIHKDALMTMIQDKSSRVRYAASLIEPTVRCLNVFSQHKEITPYFATVLAIICSDNWNILSPVIEAQDIMNILIALTRQFSDPYLRNVFLFVLSQLANAEALRPALIQNPDIFLPYLNEGDVFNPRSSSFSSSPNAERLLVLFESVWQTDRGHQIPRDRMLGILSILAQHSIQTMLNEMIPAVDEAILQMLHGNRENSEILNWSQFCHSVALYYNSLISAIRANRLALHFDGSLNCQAVNFIVFFIENSGIPEISSNSPDYNDWLPFFLLIVEDLYSDNKELPDLQIRRSYLIETDLLKAVIHCLAHSMELERDDQVTQLTSAVFHIIEAYRNDIVVIASFLMPDMQRLLVQQKAKKYYESVFDFCTRSLVTYELYESFIESGFESFKKFIQERKDHNKSYDKFVIRIMEKFSSIDVSDSLIRAISLGYQMISDNVYFENQVLQIAGQILELQEVDLNNGDDLDFAVDCLNTLIAQSSTLNKEEKGVLKQALKRIHRRSCSCVVL